MSAEILTLYGVVITVLWAALTYFLKQTMAKVDNHDTDINHIKQTYVAKEEMDKVRSELRGDITGMTDDISRMKDVFLTKEDFYRSQAAVDKKLDKIYDLILQMKGSSGDG